MDTVLTIAQVALTVLGAVVAVLVVVAPLTKTKMDDSLLGYLQKAIAYLGDLLGKFLPGKGDQVVGGNKAADVPAIIIDKVEKTLEDKN